MFSNMQHGTNAHEPHIVCNEISTSIFTVLGNGRRRSLQHLLRKVDKNLVELSPTQQVKVLNDLETKKKRTWHS